MSTVINRIAGFFGRETRSVLPSWADPSGTRGPILSGSIVTERTALGISAVWNAVTIYANAVSSIDAFVAERTDDRESWGTSRPAREHPASSILSFRPNDVQTSAKFRQTLMIHALTGGNGYAEIEWADRSRYIPRALHLLDPKSVDPIMGDDGKLRYKINDGRDELAARDVIHVFGLSSNGFKGISPIGTFRQTLGLATSQEAYQSSLMANNSTPNGYLQLDRVLLKHQKDQIRSDHEELHKGTNNTGRVGVLDGGLRWVQTSFSPADAELLLSREFSVAEVARIFNLPQYMLGLVEKTTSANLEQNNLQFFTYSLMPWLVTIEQELAAKLIHPADRGKYSIAHDSSRFLRGDLRTRTAYVKDLFGLGALSRNEVRAEFGLSPVEFGDDYYIPTNNLSPVGPEMGDGPALDPDAPQLPDGSTGATGRRSAPILPIGHPSVIRRDTP